MLVTTAKLLVSAVAIAGRWPLIAALDSPQQQQLVSAVNDNVEGEEQEGGDWEGQGDEFLDGVMGRNPLTRDFRRKVVRWLGRWHVPGLAVGVVDGEDIWTQGYGIATFPSTPVTPTTLFYGASTSKAFTAATLAIMIDSGNYTTLGGSTPGTPLDWTTPISALIPDDFVLMDDPWATTHITLEDALSHRTGLPRHDKANVHFLPSETDATKRRVATPRDVVRMLRHLPLNAAPRTMWQYCNQMFVVAGHVIQTLTGSWLGDLLRTWIWDPLGMHSTYFSLEDALTAPEHFAAGYSWVPERGEFVTVPYMPLDEVSGAGAVVSCVEDYTKWIRMMLREDAPVPKEGHRSIKTPRMIIDPQSVFSLAGYGYRANNSKAQPYDAPQSYALGWIMGSYRGHTFWTHSGGMHAYGAEVFFFPSLDFGVVTFGNTAGSSNWVGLFAVWQLVDDKLGVPGDERHDWEADFRGAGDEKDDLMANAINKTYPDRPSTPIAPALLLHAYEGTYHHPAYQNFTLTTTATSSENKLVAHRPDATWPTTSTFEHVSGEYWMMFQQYGTGDGNRIMSEYAPVQFRVGSNGKVAAMGVTWLEVVVAKEDKVEGLVWFDKIA